jgi:hypothetical protein
MASRSSWNGSPEADDLSDLGKEEGSTRLAGTPARSARGLYDWHDHTSAEAYVRALWWALIVVSERSSIHYAVLPGIRRDDLLKASRLADNIAVDDMAAWWRTGVTTHWPGPATPTGAVRTAETD